MNFILIGLVVYFISAFYDAVKIKEKYYLRNTHEDKDDGYLYYLQRPYFHHSNGWHYGCISIWFILFSLFAYIYDWRCIFLMLSFFLEDLFYYVIHYFYFGEFLPERLDWLAEGKFNPIRYLTGGKVTRLQFIILLIMQLTLTTGLILWTM